MRTRRDQVQAYRFVTRRIVSAMVSGEPETNDLPMRRLGLALVGSVLVGALVLGVFGAYGLLTENRAPLEPDTLVVEKETGAKYVFTRDKLYLVTNYASARLIIGTESPTIRHMSAGSLKNRPRTLPVGILNAPDALPDPKDLAGDEWRVCSNFTTDQTDLPVSTLLVNRSLGGAATLAGDEAVLVNAADAGGEKAFYLLWNNTRLAVPRPALVGLDPNSALPVAAELVNAVKAGPNLEAPRLEGLGTPFDGTVDGQTADVGTVFEVNDRFYVLAGSGLSQVGRLTAELLTAATGDDPRETTAQEVDRLQTDERVEPEGFPASMPRLRQSVSRDRTAICDLYDVPNSRHTIEVFDTRPDELAIGLEGNTDSAIRGATATVDRVLVTGGAGALIQSMLPDGKAAPGSTVYLLTDDGRKFALGNTGGSAQAALGYTGAPVSPVPLELIELIPAGPALEIEAARRSVTSAAATG
ncbi:type VII secretion protein EccB [Catenuloplanes atrovinosus]|uniref:Type VII secretion protein EccB n=1 Tax=Catenuloplanes atrovinosus TaxID=137266 RepID=A0AAE3YXF0_9ACTN|nr:type VII secretion protein EccB [Catenuloplanes atrovinosus]MDR7280957.1 type VII secretion protein EccB [Catenuloplanes atrovinosus]